MSPANSVNPAWLTVPPAGSLPEAVAAEIGPVAKKIGSPAPPGYSPTPDTTN